ncbi:MAG TPA: hypothetical protein VGE67_05470 [Haloferula sp.]
MGTALCSVAGAAGTPAAFVKADVDADGFIDPAEFANAKRGLGAKAALKAFVRQDADEDGQISPVEFFGAAKLARLASKSQPGAIQVVSGIVSAWAKADPRSAADWVSSLPERPASVDLAIADIVNAWAQSDAEAAQSWLDSLPDRPERPDRPDRPEGRP